MSVGGPTQRSMSLRRRLAAHGFEANEDYDHALRVVAEADHDHLRALNLVSAQSRRKTAFAHALARATEAQHVLYHDFSAPIVAPAPVVIRVNEDGEAEGSGEPPVSPLDRVVLEACAYSEASRTVLTLDQMQAAPFADVIRITELVRSRQWQRSDGIVSGHPRNLLLLLLSDEPLYHSLHKLSFRVYVDPAHDGFDYRPQDFALGSEWQGIFDSLAALFDQLGQAPTRSELARLLDDLKHRVGGEESLRQSIYGWVELADRERLYASALRPALRAVIDASYGRRGGLDEAIELGGQPVDGQHP